MMCGNCASQELYSAGEEKFGTDEGKFVNILSTRSVEHLREGMHVCVFVCECVCVCVCKFICGLCCAVCVCVCVSVSLCGCVFLCASFVHSLWFVSLCV